MIQRSLRVAKHGVQNYRALFEKIPQSHYLGPSTRKLCSLWIDSDLFGASDRAFVFDGDRVEHKRNWSGTGHRRNTSIGCLPGDCWIRNPHHVEPSADRLANQLVDRSRRTLW